MESGVQTISFRQMAPGVRSSVKLLEIELGRMNGHSQRLGKCQRSEDWTGLTREHTQSLKTIQSLKTNLTMMNEMRSKLKETQLKQFDIMVASAYGQALRILVDVLQKQSKGDFRTTDQLPTCNLGDQSNATRTLNPAETEDTDPESRDTCDTLTDKETQNKQDDMHVQSEEYNADTKETEENETTPWMNYWWKKASGMNKKSVGPVAAAVTGGILGGVLLGPIGTAVGVKLAAVALGGAVGGQLGFAGGQSIQEQDNEAAEQEEDELKKPLLDDKKEEPVLEMDQTGVEVTAESVVSIDGDGSKKENDKSATTQTTLNPTENEKMVHNENSESTVMGSVECGTGDIESINGDGSKKENDQSATTQTTLKPTENGKMVHNENSDGMC